MIKTEINSYNSKIEGLSQDDMYNVELQRDLARDCVIAVEGVLTSWRNWRQGKK